MRRRVDATIGFPDWRNTIVWVNENATDEEIRTAIIDEILEEIEIHYHIHEEE